MLIRRWILAGAVVAVAGGVAFAAGQSLQPQRTDPELVGFNRPDQRMVGLVDGRTLVSLRGNDADDVRTIGAVRGLRDDTRLIGIDYRVQDGKLYGVGERGGIYTIETREAKATKVSALTVALSGTLFDIDFNPAANRLRVVSDTGQNLRHNLDDPAGTPAAGTTVADTALSPATGITGAAYTNNDNNADTATTLFDLNVMTDQVVVQSPANNGTLAPTGKFGVDADGDAGFDISASNVAFAVLKVDGRYRLYRTDLLTGVVRGLGSFPSRTQVSDIAIPISD